MPSKYLQLVSNTLTFSKYTYVSNVFPCSIPVEF